MVLRACARGRLLFRLSRIGLHPRSLTLNPNLIQIVDATVFVESDVALRMRLLSFRGCYVKVDPMHTVRTLDQQYSWIKVGLNHFVGAGRQLGIACKNGKDVVKSTPFPICAERGIADNRVTIVTTILHRLFMNFLAFTRTGN